MIYAESTHKGVGLTLYGDYYDLKDLHNSIASVIECANLDEESENILFNLCYEIRHAFMGDREKDIKPDQYHTDDNKFYFGVKLIWPLIIFQISLLKTEVRCCTNKRDKANILILESVIEYSLYQLDKEVAKQCIETLHTLGSYPDDYLLSYVDFQAYDFVFGTTTKKQRIESLPNMIKSLSSISDEYREFKTQLQLKAAQLDTNIHSLIDTRKWEKFNW